MAKKNPTDLTKKEIKILKQKLVDEKNKLIHASGDYKDFYETNTGGNDDVDKAHHDAQNAYRLRFRNREIHYIKKINNALERIENEEYGTCVECPEPIGYERLQARPTAELCIVCKEEAEREERFGHGKDFGILQK